VTIEPLHHTATTISLGCHLAREQLPPRFITLSHPFPAAAPDQKLSPHRSFAI
jgi:hypothetical protein